MKNPAFNLYIKITAVTGIILGILVIIGWYIDSEILKSVFTGLATMKFNTAICFILCSIALFLIEKNENKYNYLQKLLLTIVLLIAGVTLSQYAFNYNSGLDELFVPDITTKNKLNDFPGRMATATAFCFLCMSTALMLITSVNRIAKLAAQYILHFVTLIAFIAAIGYLYKIPSFYKLSFLSSMALNTCILFFILSIAGSMINHEIGITGLFTGHKMGSMVARRLFPLITLVVLVLGFFRLLLYWYNFVNEDFGIALYTISFILVLLLVIALTAKQLNKIDARRNKAVEALRDLNTNLVQLVEERTEQIQKISERLSLATTGSKIGIWDWDITENKMTWDDKMYQLYGLTKSSFVGAYESWENGIHPDDKETTRQAIEMATNGKGEFDKEFRVIWPDKSVHYIKAKSLTQRNAAGKAIRMIGTNWDITEQVLLQNKLENEKEQNQKIILKTAIESQENERTYLGYELHENVNQLLASANIYLGLANKDNGLKTAELILESKRLITNAIEEIRKLTLNIRHSHIEDIGLFEAINDFIHKINSMNLVKIEFKPTIDPAAIPPDIALTVYRIIQEQLNNILKYAEAKNVNIRFDRLTDDLLLIIADDGKGADVVDFKKGKGLLNIINRTKAYNGKAAFETSPGNGFKIIVELPLLQKVNTHK